MLAGMMARPRATSSRTKSAGSPSRVAMNCHLRRDLALARVMQLRDRLAGLRVRAARRDPRLAQLRQALPRIVTLRAAGVVEANRRLAAAKRHLANGTRSARPLACRRTFVETLVEFGNASANVLAVGTGVDFDISALPPPV